MAKERLQATPYTTNLGIHRHTLLNLDVGTQLGPIIRQRRRRLCFCWSKLHNLVMPKRLQILSGN